MALDRTYSVRWFGPFDDVEEVKRFEDKHKSTSFQLYIINGYKPRAKIYDHYYCGQTQRCVYKRLTDTDHHIKELKVITAIWIGTISSVEPEHADINTTENIITAQLSSIFGEKYMLNKINTRFPKHNVYVVNIWHNTKGGRMKNYQQFTIPAVLPDVIGHEYDKEMDSHLLYSASKIKWSEVNK